MDFISALPTSTEGYEGILTVVDKFSKMCHFIPLKDTTDAVEVAELFMKNVVRLHGVPSTVISDRDSRFISRFWRALMNTLEVDHRLSTAFHPETDG
jgi:hypothetical protein